MPIFFIIFLFQTHLIHSHRESNSDVLGATKVL
uniref:Uncharacterized protein n=1 Tax=Setaria viridis TaxID=4556 RepID=A0A4U6T5T4_SETVI|nr:hypothetical protein SEVIR_9G153250v2 [Setaria viridis]